jgi:hypothetical protein
MTTFTIDAENNITAFRSTDQTEVAIGAGCHSFASQKELERLVAAWPAARLVETWNGFAGVAPFSDLKTVKKFTDRRSAVSRIWQAVQKLASRDEEAGSVGQGQLDAPAAAPSPEVAAPKEKAAKAESRAKGKASAKGTKPKKTAGARDGSKTVKVLDLIQRPKGATLTELMKATQWQAHSVRGFVSGTLGTKMKLKIDSVKREDGERVYSIAK